MSDFTKKNSRDSTRLRERQKKSLRKELSHQEQENAQSLNRISSPLEAAIAEWSIFVARSLQPLHHPLLNQEEVQRANKSFLALFPGKLKDLLKDALHDAAGYRQRIKEYESGLSMPPYVDFETHNELYRLTVNKSLRRQEELFICKSLIDNFGSGNEFCKIADLGTGSGRIVFKVAEFLNRFLIFGQFQIIGLDINQENLKDARSKNLYPEYKRRLLFAAGDATHCPLSSDTFLLGIISSALHLLPVYLRPLLLLEMTRVVQVLGEGIITGPNERFSAEEYIRSTGVYNLGVFMLQGYFSWLYMVRQGMLINEMSRTRKDFALPVVQEVCEALLELDCLLEVESWPRSMGRRRDIYTGIRFRITPETRKRLKNSGYG